MDMDPQPRTQSLKSYLLETLCLCTCMYCPATILEALYGFYTGCGTNTFITLVVHPQ